MEINQREISDKITEPEPTAETDRNNLYALEDKQNMPYNAKAVQEKVNNYSIKELSKKSYEKK